MSRLLHVFTVIILAASLVIAACDAGDDDNAGAPLDDDVDNDVEDPAQPPEEGLPI